MAIGERVANCNSGGKLANNTALAQYAETGQAAHVACQRCNLVARVREPLTDIERRTNTPHQLARKIRCSLSNTI